MDQPEIAAAITTLGWLELIKRIGGFLVIAGVAIEVGGDWLATPLHKKVDDARELQVEQLKKETAEAQLALARFRRPRAELLTTDALNEIAGKLRQFPGSKFDTGLSANSGEQADFLWRLEAALTNVSDAPQGVASAGWIELGWGVNTMGLGAQILRRGNRPVSGSVAAQNVEIHLHPSHRAQLLPAATALIEALNEAGIVAKDSGFNTHSSNDDAIHIVIGEKQ